jgi:hypothetical protein
MTRECYSQADTDCTRTGAACCVPLRPAAAVRLIVHADEGVLFLSYLASLELILECRGEVEGGSPETRARIDPQRGVTLEVETHT